MCGKPGYEAIGVRFTAIDLAPSFSERIKCHVQDGAAKMPIHSSKVAPSAQYAGID